jgi:hypothetical protein
VELKSPEKRPVKGTVVFPEVVRKQKEMKKTLDEVKKTLKSLID